MLTLEHILKVGRMMHQTGGQYFGFHEDHNSPESQDIKSDYHVRPDKKFVKIKLFYECDADGDLRIVQK